MIPATLGYCLFIVLVTLGYCVFITQECTYAPAYCYIRTVLVVRQTQILINEHRIQRESVLISVSV